MPKSAINKNMLTYASPKATVPKTVGPATLATTILAATWRNCRKILVEYPKMSFWANIYFQISIFLINFAGTPPTKEFEGKDFVTTLPAATTIFSPNSTPKTIEFAPK